MFKCLGRFKSVAACCAATSLVVVGFCILPAASSADVYGGWALNAPALACCGDTPVGQSFFLQEEIGGGTGIHGDVGSSEIHNGDGDIFQYFIDGNP